MNLSRVTLRRAWHCGDTSLEPGEEAPRPWCPTATGGLAAFPPQGQGLGEQVLAEPSVKVPVDMGYPQSLEKEGQKMDLCRLP